MAGIALSLIAVVVTVHGLQLNEGAYEDLVIKIADNVPDKDCRIVLENLEGTLTSASQYLFSALDSRAYLRSATVLLPAAWPDSCAPSAVHGASGETSDITVLPSNPLIGKIYTQQSLGCGQPGDQIYLSYSSLQETDNTLSRLLIKEFAMYRYGVFEEQGYHNDPIYPMCYYDDKVKKPKATGCSDLPLIDDGLCSSDSAYNLTEIVDPKARSSIMFAAEAPSVSMFCDEGNHDRFAPTKHNLLCQRRSVLDVIINHQDFAQNNQQNNFSGNQITDTTPKITYKKQNLTRFLFVIEDTKDMLQRESWFYLRLAIRQWAIYVLPGNTEVGLVLFNSTTPNRALNILPISGSNGKSFTTTTNRESFYSALPYTPSESMEPGCLDCSLKQALEMLNERTKTNGPANNVIVAIAPGMNLDDNLKETAKRLKANGVKVASINYPNIVRPSTLRYLADETGGVDYTIFEKKLNVDTTLLTTYFEFHSVLYDIVQRFYSGSQADLPVEIHRREIIDDGRTSVTGSFVMDPSMSEPAQFTFYTHNTVTPLIKGLKLISPSHQVYSSRTDKLLDFKMITLNANWSESGIWTYTVEPYPGNPQPHFLQMRATPVSVLASVVRASFRTHRSAGGPLVLLVEAKYGDMPILGAKVEVLVTKKPLNGTALQDTKIELLDTGAGDPDITKGDGVYTRYFSANEPGLYTFEAVVTNNDNTAYTWSSSINYDKPCCGSSISSNGVQLISPFQRILTKSTIMITAEDIEAASLVTVGRIGDLKVEVIPADMKARLSWTSPDMGGHTVTRYEIKYAHSVTDILDKFETSAVVWETGSSPYPLDPGSETTFTIDLAQNKQLLDKPLYFAVKAYGKTGANFSGPISNYVRVFVPSPPPPPTIAPTYIPNESFWPNNGNNVGIDPVRPTVARSMSVGIELILPVVIGIVLLLALLVVYCYFCVVRKRTVSNHKSTKANGIKKDNLNSTITIVPSTPQNVAPPQVQNYASDVPDPHQVGVPVNNYGYEDETKKRYSLVNQQEQQLIEELKQQQQHLHQQRENLPPSYAGLSVISNNTINRNGQPLSPYNSWSASQLLHEHERRYSPMDNMMSEEPMLMHPEVVMAGAQMEHMSMNGQSMDHVSINGHQIAEHYGPNHLPPPVPPLPAFNNGYPVNFNIYGVHQAPPQQNQIYQSVQRTEQVPFNASLQGSMTSVNSGEKKRRNVTMV
ncbi:calcium-activated chloride channel regulator 1-like isoform X2 [Cylas formicarius]|uniref:calcium-activated chloride channel regulator 1-like isoform X2 n=1 Tax=Cylas formicarius TaxID=197179 RepID=UPI002958BE3C|nr:calcium-activated chloride channel regulator 1-like isoform X2 [Cylas formicarius]